MSRSRSICITLNNYTEEEVKKLQEFCENECTYYVYQRERGENGTPHIQGYLHIRNQRTLAAWKKCLGPRYHIEFARGSALDSRVYCTKEETREPGTEPSEGGRIPAQGTRSDLESVAALVRTGQSDARIAEEHPGDFIRYARGIERLRSVYEPRRTWKTEVYWWYGPTGTGKTRKAFEQFPDAYWKMGGNRWWDGYAGDAHVIVDDYRRDLAPFNEILRMLDRYPYRVECKGGSHQFLARVLVITTPKDPRETWAGRVQEDLLQLFRRIDEVREFSRDGESTVVTDAFRPGGSKYQDEPCPIVFGVPRCHSGGLTGSKALCGGYDEELSQDGYNTFVNYDTHVDMFGKIKN